MKDTIIIKVEEVEFVFGKMVRFWKGDNVLVQVGLNRVIKEMNALTNYYNNVKEVIVLFAIK